MKKGKCLLFLLVFYAKGASSFAESLEKTRGIASDLASYLREARSVISKRPGIIDEPTSVRMNQKQFTELVNRNFLRKEGRPFVQSISANIYLVKATEEVFAEVTSGSYREKWRGGLYDNKFLPARFAREVALKVTEQSQGHITIRLTAPDRFLVNPENLADSWERAVFSKMASPEWEKNQAYQEVFTEGNRSEFRYFLPEYYKRDCLGCHGGEEGKKIHREHIAGNLGEVGGAISIRITLEKKAGKAQ